MTPTARPYDPRAAWLRAAIYFAACWLIALASGALAWMLSLPAVTSGNVGDAGWLAFTLACIVIEFVAYWVIWPKGTLAHGRALNVIAVGVFGVAWGLSEGVLFVSIWRAADVLIASRVAATLAAFVVISAFIGLWHRFYWDIHVAPEHNIAAWNGRKVLFAHIPNLVATLTYLAVYESAWMFVLFQTIALVGSTYFMRFPAFWRARAT